MSFKSKPVPSALLRPRPSGNYSEIDNKSVTKKRLQRLWLDLRPSSGNGPKEMRLINEAADLFIHNDILDADTLPVLHHFAIQIAEAQARTGAGETVDKLFAIIRGSNRKISNREFGNALLTGAVEACHRIGRFDLALRMAEGITEQVLLVETYFKTAELARSSEQQGLAVRCLTQYIFPAIDRLEQKEVRVKYLLVAAELCLSLSLLVEAKLIVYKIIDQLSPMDYIHLEATAIIMIQLGLKEDAIHLLTDDWFRQSFSEDPRFRTEQEIRLNLINDRYPRFADHLQFARR